MKKFLFALFVMATLCSCQKYTTEDLAEEVRDHMRKELSSEGAYVHDVRLIHLGGDNYEGVAKISCDGVTLNYDITVVVDGMYFTWEIQ
ncbi:MAG: hypothetical protein J6V23_09110 [Bacteroidaceae bacterium]|nr:hypothetical protein [Bacteroidaceae bacterium]